MLGEKEISVQLKITDVEQIFWARYHLNKNGIPATVKAVT